MERNALSAKLRNKVVGRAPLYIVNGPSAAENEKKLSKSDWPECMRMYCHFWRWCFDEVNVTGRVYALSHPWESLLTSNFKRQLNQLTTGYFDSKSMIAKWIIFIVKHWSYELLSRDQQRKYSFWPENSPRSYLKVFMSSSAICMAIQPSNGGSLSTFVSQNIFKRNMYTP